MTPAAGCIWLGRSEPDCEDEMAAEREEQQAEAESRAWARRELMSEILSRMRRRTAAQLTIEELQFFWPKETR